MEFIAEDGTKLTNQVLNNMALEYEDGTWTGHGPISTGRPRLYDEDMTTVSFRIPKSRIAAIERLTESRGQSKSDFFREAIDAALLAGA